MHASKGLEHGTFACVPSDKPRFSPKNTYLIIDVIRQKTLMKDASKRASTHNSTYLSGLRRRPTRTEAAAPGDHRATPRRVEHLGQLKIFFAIARKIPAKCASSGTQRGALTACLAELRDMSVDVRNPF